MPQATALRAGAAAVLLGSGIVSAQQCGNLVKGVTFEGVDRIGSDNIPYVETFAYQDWAPYSYLDGFYDDPSTRGTTNQRAELVTDGDSKGLQVMLPEGCVTGACAMQAKSHLLVPIESATLRFKMKFGPEFDWVRGGKLPGLCGARCLTGCKEVTGLDGWSARQMWRPCVWPPEHELNTINCSGGKIVNYVYHMYKEHWCGDDFEYANELWSRDYTTPQEPVVPKSFFQPAPDEWYTIWNYVKMNTAGPPEEAENFQRDGVLQTWMQGPDFGPLLVVEKNDMSFRRYNNVSIDTLYFSVFFGGSSDSFKAKKDETIIFDDFLIFEGKCEPGQEPASLDVAPTLATWDNMKSDLSKPTTIKTSIVFKSAFTGGGCADVIVENVGDQQCDEFSLEVNIRPSWGTLMEKEGVPSLNALDLLESDETAGWWSTKSVEGRGDIEPGTTNDVASFCVRNYQKAKYLPADLNAHVVGVATCSAGAGASETGTSQDPFEGIPPPPPPPAEVPETLSPDSTVVAGDPEWCATTSGEGGVWDIFGRVKAALCSPGGGFDKPWGPVDVTTVQCLCGTQPVFPDNLCEDVDEPGACADVECSGSQTATYDGRCVDAI